MGALFNALAVADGQHIRGAAATCEKGAEQKGGEKAHGRFSFHTYFASWRMPFESQ